MNISEKVQKVSHSGKHYLFLLRDGSVRTNGVFRINEYGGSGFSDIHDSIFINNIKAIDIAVMSGTIWIKRGSGSNIYPVTRYAIIDDNHNLHYWGTWFGPTDQQTTKDLRHAQNLLPRS